MYRVYSCAKCGNIAFTLVREKSEECRCSACDTVVIGSPEHSYVDNQTRAGWVVSWRVFHRHENDPRWLGRGLRNALVTFRVVEAEWKRSGRSPIEVERVLSICRGSGLQPSETRASLEWLGRDGRLRLEGSFIIDVLDSEVEPS